MRLRLVGTHREDPLEHVDRGVELARLPEPPSVHPHERRIVEAELEQVRQHAEPERPIATREEEVAAVEEERRAGRVVGPLGEIDRVGSVGLAQLAQVRRVGRPRLDRDGRCGWAAGRRVAGRSVELGRHGAHHRLIKHRLINQRLISQQLISHWRGHRA